MVCPPGQGKTGPGAGKENGMRRKGMPAPCLGCRERRLGCHDGAVCRAWGEFEAANEARRQRTMQSFRANDDWLSARTQQAKWRRRHGT